MIMKMNKTSGKREGGWEKTMLIYCMLGYVRMQGYRLTYPLHFFPVGKSQPVAHTGIHL